MKWARLAMPKDQGGWGIRNIHFFCRSLAAKSLWRLVHSKSLWGRVMATKYIPGLSFVEWFRRPQKLVANSSIGWKALVGAFPLIGDWTVWQIGNGKSVRIGANPWLGAGAGYKLFEELIEYLNDHGIFSIWDAKQEVVDNFRRSS